MNRGLLIVLSILLIGNLGMYFYEDPVVEFGDENPAKRNLPSISSPPAKNPGLINSITAGQGKNDSHHRPTNPVTQSIKKETNRPNFGWSPQNSDTGEIVDPDDEQLMAEYMSRHRVGQTVQDTGEYIDPDDEFMMENMLRDTGEQKVQDTGEYIDPDK